MNIRPARIAAVTAAATLLMGVPVSAQQPAPRPRVPDSVRALVQEAQQIQRRLAEIQQTALEQNPELEEQGKAVDESIKAAMRDVDPKIDQRIERLNQVKSEFAEARSANDTAKARSLLREAQQIQKRIAATRSEVVQREAIEEEMTAFREDMLAAMRKVDPKTDDLIARLEEITNRLQQA